MSPRQDELSAAGWAVLGVVAEGPTHGFAVAQIMGKDGPVGRVWTLPRPLVYRELNKLLSLDLVAERENQRSEHGPMRTILAARPQGRRAVSHWLRQPVDHVRDVRSSLLLKLVLLERSGEDPRMLLEAQRQRLQPQVAGLQELRDRAEGFDRVLAQWRLVSSQATVQFVDSMLDNLS